MSQNIIDEMSFLLHSVIMGVMITFVYDGFLVLRRLIRHSLFLISLEDLIFWIACAIGVFYMLYEENNGVLRWFAVFGAAVGMLVYKGTISALLVNVMSTIIKKIVRIFFQILHFFLRPVRFIYRKIRRICGLSASKGKKAGKYLKNKLTVRLKLLKITLCKH